LEPQENNKVIDKPIRKDGINFILFKTQQFNFKN
jgi:hypothetical protein